jgi:methyltransferase-like protein
MRYHNRDITNKLTATKSSREFYAKVVEAISPQSGAYKIAMENDFERTRYFTDSYITHDTLSDINNPFCFYQFVEAANKEKLQYLGDAVFHSMIANNVTPQAIALLKEVGPDIIDAEQCLDFINNRYFRSTLLCHDNIELIRAFNPEVLKQFYFAAPLHPHSHHQDLLNDKTVSFKPLNGPDISTPDPVAKLLLAYLADAWPKAASFVEINAYLQRELSSSSKELTTQALQYLWRSYTLGLLRIYIQPPQLVTEVSTMPCAAPIARYQATIRHACLTNQLHEEVPLTPLLHHLLPHLDGKHDHAALLDIMVELAKQKKITLQQSGAAITDAAKLKIALKSQLDKTLQEIAKLALLIG